MNTIEQLLERSMQACDNGNYELAIELANKLLYLYQAPSGYYALGLVYAVQENWVLAKENCLKVHHVNPEIADNLNRLGVACCHLGEYEEGLAYLKQGMYLGNDYCIANYY